MIIDGSWVDLLNDKSNVFRKHCFIKSLFKKGNLDNCLHQSFKSFGEKKDIPLLRIYVENGHRYDLSGNIIEGIYDEDFSLEQFETDLSQNLGYKEFCITFNGLTKWNPAIDEMIRKSLVDPLINKIGIPSRGLDSYAFIGNYGFTPFGIHDDDDHSILFHLGSAKKDVWVLPRQKYLELNGNCSPSFNYNQYLPQFEHYVLHEGDFLFIPKGDFHVFQTHGFSITLGLTIFPKTQTNSRIDVFEEIERLDNNEQKDEFFEAGNAGNAYIPKNVYRLAENSLLLRRKSNMFLTTLPLLQKINIPRNAILKRIRLNKIYELHKGNRSFFFVNGRHFSLQSSEPISQMFNRINNEEYFRIETFSSDFESKISPDVIWKIFEILVEFGLLRIVESGGKITLGCVDISSEPKQ